MKFAQNSQDYYALAGGLDLVSPAISIPAGKCIDCQNYEPEISGGYRRIAGRERFDGRTSPSSASYWIVSYAQIGAISVGNTLTGATSGATMRVLSVTATQIIAGRVTGTFTSTENLLNGVVVGTLAGVPQQGAAQSSDDDATYSLLAANDLRADIQAVPGSGAIRGVWVYKDIAYAFRDNIGATAGLMYKATASGWQLVVFPYQIQFNTGSGTPYTVGSVVSNGLGVTATVIAVVTRTGTWGGTATGTLIITPPSGGSFGIGNTLTGTASSTATSVSSQVTRLPGGQLDACNYNFTGSTATQKMYGADGVNLAFEFDGTSYIPIRTGMAVDTPSHVVGYQNYLFLSFKGSLQYSALLNPYAWTVLLGAGEIATGDEITGLIPQGGNDVGSALAIFTKVRTHILYGTSNTDFKLQTSTWDIGYSAFTMQPVSNNTYGLTARGIQSLAATQKYGDFEYASISQLVQPFLTARRGMETASTIFRQKNQYRVFFSDGTGLAVGLTGAKVTGVMALNYGIPVRCMCTSTLTTGVEVTYFGSDDGYVYQDNIGTSFDGSAIEAWVRLAFNHEHSPRLRKRFRRAVLEVKADIYSKINVSYDIGYASPNAQPAAAQPDTTLLGGGGYWEQFTWDQFVWDTEVILSPSISLDGTEKNISLIFYSNRAQDSQHTLQGITLIYSPRRTER